MSALNAALVGAVCELIRETKANKDLRESKEVREALREAGYAAPAPHEAPYVSIEQAAKFVGATTATLRRAVTAGELPSIKPGRSRCVRVADVVAWAEARGKRPRKGRKRPAALTLSDIAAAERARTGRK